MVATPTITPILTGVVIPDFSVSRVCEGAGESWSSLSAGTELFNVTVGCGYCVKLEKGDEFGESASDDIAAPEIAGMALVDENGNEKAILGMKI